MMVIKHLSNPPKHVRDSVGAAQQVLLWGYGVSTGHVSAVQVLPDGSADLVVEFERPEAVVVPDVCERAQSCRFDPTCPFVDGCVRYRDE